MVKILQNGNYTIYGEGDPAGGEEIIVRPCDCHGAEVIVIWGADYGCGVEYIKNLTEFQYQYVIKLESTYDMKKYLEKIPG